MPIDLTTILTGLALATAAAADETGEIAVRGTLTDEGVECPALRGADGRLYTLLGETGGLHVGARVCVRGRVAQISHCMQGITLVVRELAAAETCPE
ncbi:MAG: DUF5818 domain-containing protein [Alphaproteobacteria bacterium]|jgi:hypothetical protein|nr:DUF5818 domain-containing protein [Alphaproteobacteria bacterium]MDP6517025.1 DUF5818 domain-containing protein [Alphaproteobacteria bacterium]